MTDDVVRARPGIDTHRSDLRGLYCARAGCVWKCRSSDYSPYCRQHQGGPVPVFTAPVRPERKPYRSLVERVTDIAQEYGARAPNGLALVAEVLDRTPGALERALYRADAYDLIERLKGITPRAVDLARRKHTSTPRRVSAT